MGFVCEVFVLLAGCTSPYVLFNPLAHAWPVETSQCFPDGLIPSWVARQSVVVGVHYPSFELVTGQNECLPIFHDPESRSLSLLPPMLFNPF